jgi:hypothetical protein
VDQGLEAAFDVEAHTAGTSSIGKCTRHTYLHVAPTSYQARHCKMGDTRPQHMNYVLIVSGLAVSAPDEIMIVHG